MQNQRSEVASILTQIAAEYEAASRGLEGLALGVSRHEFITHRMENMGRLHGDLVNLIGSQQAIEMVAHRIDNLNS